MNELLSLKDKNYALSGGTGTLGGSIAQYLVENGAKVLLLGRSEDKLKDKQNDLNALVPNSTFVFKVDVMDESELVKLKNKINEEFKQLYKSSSLKVPVKNEEIPTSEIESSQSFIKSLNILINNWNDVVYLL